MHDKTLVTNLKPFFLPRRCSRKSHCKDFREHLAHLVPCAALRHFIFTFRHCKQARGLTNGQPHQTVNYSRCLPTSPVVLDQQAHQAHQAPFSFSLSESLKIAEPNATLNLARPFMPRSEARLWYVVFWRKCVISCTAPCHDRLDTEYSASLAKARNTSGLISG
jgi:hypothetical protein